MKPVNFSYEQAISASQISTALENTGLSVKLLAGGQSLGPMLNLRLVQPDLILDISRIDELKTISLSADALLVGACVSHANLEDLNTRNKTEEILANIARGIAYRAVRTRGTIGGSLAHADPSADWLTTFLALDASLIIHNSQTVSKVRLSQVIKGAFNMGLQRGDWIHSIQVPLVKDQDKWKYVKLTRKTGEFSHAMAAVLWRHHQNTARIVIGATEKNPVIYHFEGSIERSSIHRIEDDIAEQFRIQEIGDAADNRIRLVALRRALQALSE